MNIAAVREQIKQAQQHESRTGHLQQRLEQHLPQLHPMIQLPQLDQPGTLARFISAYIEQVPDVLEAAHEVACEAGIETQIKPVLKIAEAYFLQPPSVVEGEVGLACLLDEAYLAHRLVEEVNDLYIRHFQQPLIPVDTTVANLIAHQLIGEGFANKLDEVVHHSVEELLGEDVFATQSAQDYRETLANPQTNEAWKRWPCFSQKLSVMLDLQQAAS